MYKWRPTSPDVPSYPHGAPSLSTGTLLRSVYVRKRKICLLPIQRIRPNAKFNRELCRKKQEPNKAKRPINFTPKDQKRLVQARAKADFEAKFYAQLLKKAAI